MEEYKMNNELGGTVSSSKGKGIAGFLLGALGVGAGIAATIIWKKKKNSKNDSEVIETEDDNSEE